VTLFGSFFSDIAMPVCRIGSHVVVAQHVFGGLSCIVGPSTRSGIVSVEVSGNGVQFSTVGSLFAIPSSTLLRLEPSCGSLTGGTNVLVSGDEGFSRVSGMWCRFCDDAVVSAGMDGVGDGVNVVTCSSPAQRHPNNCSVEISSDRQLWLLAGLFEYRNFIRVHAISPSVGIVSGGTAVSVHANEVRAGDSLICQFGSVQSVAVVAETGHFICVTPAVNQSHVVDFSVSFNGQEWSVGSALFAYIDPIELLWVEPHAVIAGRNQSIRIGISNLMRWTGSVQCRFGGLHVVSGLFIDDHVLCSGYLWSVPVNTSVDVVLGASISSNTKVFQVVQQNHIVIHPLFVCHECHNLVTVSGLYFRSDNYSIIFDEIDLGLGEWIGDSLVVLVPSQFRCGDSTMSCMKNMAVFLHGALSFACKIQILYPPKVVLEYVSPYSAYSSSRVHFLHILFIQSPLIFAFLAQM